MQTASEDLLNFQSGSFQISQKIKKNSHMWFEFLQNVPFRMQEKLKLCLVLLQGLITLALLVSNTASPLLGAIGSSDETTSV